MPKLISGSGQIEQDTTLKLPDIEVSSTLLLPRLTTTQRNAIGTPASGLMVYDSTLDRTFLRGSSGWRRALSEEPSGGLGFPTLTQTERNNIASPFDGMMIFNSTKRDMQVYRNGSWQNIGSPAGTVVPFATELSTPDGWIICDGSQVSRSTYSDLFRAIGCTHGIGDGSTTFHLPDMRGRFLRGTDRGSAIDPDRASRSAAVAGTFTLTGTTVSGSSTITVSSTENLAPGMVVSGTGIPSTSYVLSVASTTTFTIGNSSRVLVTATSSNSNITITVNRSPNVDFVGSLQTAATARPTSSFTSDSQGSHNHRVPIYSGGGSSIVAGSAGSATDSYAQNRYTESAGAHTHTITGGGDNETRPVNISINYIIKF